jgi:hypothetical protein
LAGGSVKICNFGSSDKLWNTSSIFQPETPILRQEVPQVSPEMPDDPLETPNDRQETYQFLQEHDDDLKMTEFSWRNLSTDGEADEHLVDHFCKQGATDKYPAKPSKPALLSLLQKYMVIAGALKITRIKEGIPFFARGVETSKMSEDTGYVNQHLSYATQETDDVLREADNSKSETQTPSQEAHVIAKRAKLVYERTTRIAQEKTQEAAQEVQRIAQEAMIESRKAKKAELYKATMEKLGKLPPCPRLCRGEVFSETPCEEEEPGFSYSHIKDLVVCPNAAHNSMANRGTVHETAHVEHVQVACRREGSRPGEPVAGYGGGRCRHQ